MWQNLKIHYITVFFRMLKKFPSQMNFAGSLITFASRPSKPAAQVNFRRVKLQNSRVNFAHSIPYAIGQITYDFESFCLVHV